MDRFAPTGDPFDSIPYHSSSTESTMTYYREQNRETYNWIKKYKDLLDALNIGFLIKDMDDNILEGNEAFWRMTGRSRERTVSLNVADFYDAAEYKKIQVIQKQLLKDKVHQYEHYLPKEGGGRIPALFNISLNLDNNDTPVSVNVLITDIREQKRIEASLKSTNQALYNEKKKLETILFGIGDCVTVFDTAGKPQLSNPKGESIRGDRRNALMPLVNGHKETLSLQVGTEERQFSGRVEAVRTRDGAVNAFIEILKDVTDRKKLEKQEIELLHMKRMIKRFESTLEMVGVSKSIQRVRQMIVRCAEFESNVLILGETGVGKELAARAIHAQSDREHGPFVAVNCGAIPDSLLESELFGHVKGAFTGAMSDRPGLFQEAHGGTIFLDEIGDISGAMQVKLLRVIQEREVRPLGSNKTSMVDTRVIAATNKDLATLARQERYRPDLYYRLSVIPLTIAPLRERKEDVLPLAAHFLGKMSDKTESRPKTLDHSTQQTLMDYHWPGNARELENAMEHAMAMALGGKIVIEDLPVQIVGRQSTDSHRNGTIPSDFDRQDSGPPSSAEETTSKLPLASLSKRQEEHEKEEIKAALERYSGNREMAAEHLGISRSTLWRKIGKYQLPKRKYLKSGGIARTTI
ncbi:MAG: PAS domain S-box protein [Proteobacteria bacterium]|nr:PAS domain S-box protein [Pseudomonadota bacterium]